jgi:putative redox protein
LRFDFTGLGNSEGDFADTNFSSNVGDLVAAAEWLVAHHRGPDILIGHSLGGTAVLAAAPRIASSRAVATIGSPASAEHVLHLIGESQEQISQAGSATVELAGRPFLIKEQFLKDVAAQALPGALSGLRKALLVMHAPLDELVSIDNASQIFASAKHPKSFISLDGADHLLSRAEDARYAGKVLAAWAAHYLSDSKTAHGSPELTRNEVVARTGAAGFLTEVNAAGHPLTVDEPADVGGTEQGPSPYDLLAAALASCTSMTLQMYAKHKKLPLENATVRVSHSKIHAEDCEHCETSSGRIDRFERVIELEGDLKDGVAQRMLEIADRCPVHRTLEGEIHVVTRLSESAAV